MSGELGLGVLVCILTVEISGSYEGALLGLTLVTRSELSQAVYTSVDGLYHASNEVAVVVDPVL